MSPTKDRLNELKKIQNDSHSVDIENNSESKIHHVFTKVEAIRDNIQIINNNTARTNTIFQNNTLKITKDLQDELDSLFRSTTIIAQKVNKHLKELQNELKKIKNQSSAEYRIKNVQCSTLKAEFYKAIQESTESLEIHKNTRKNVLKKCLKLVQEEATEEELESMLEANQMDVFTGNHLITTEEARKQLQDIEERHEELLKIEKQLTEVSQLFVTIATLVEQQQESVNRVEFHSNVANEYVERAKQEVEKTTVSRKKWNKVIV
ncbi:hypothetical protein FQA39_LY00937 [Lamprigera yunnana]|nr:hypothetical protein FQA39_LY00937 [Lamprigera yunnana]